MNAPAACDATGHDPIECSCELTAADAYPNGRPPCSTCEGTGWIRQEPQIGVPGSGCTHGCPDCPAGRERLARGELRDEGDSEPRAWPCGDPRCDSMHCSRCGGHSGGQGHYTGRCANRRGPGPSHMCCPGACELTQPDAVPVVDWRADRVTLDAIPPVEPDGYEHLREEVMSAIGAALDGFETEPYGDLRMNSARAALIATGAAWTVLAAAIEQARAVVEAAKVWRITRHDQVSGMVLHQACDALSDAVAVLNGERLDRPPVAPPTAEELEAGRDIVRRATAYSKAYRSDRDGTW